MDERILKAILCSCASATKDLENSKEYKTLLEEDKFLPSIDIFNALCSSLTKLLSYKDVIRNWCRINDDFHNFEIFRDGKNVSELLKNLLEKYLTDDVLDSCDSNDNLLVLTNALICLTSVNPYYKSHVEKLLLKVAELETCDQSEYLLCHAVQKSSNLNLELSTIETIYDQSSYIFLLVCAFLKELFVQLDHAPTVLNFIQSTLKHIKEYCENQGKNILDLYPRNLQSLIILLQIEPTHHTDNSKNATLRTLENIYINDDDTVITLLSHYPQWLQPFGQLLNSNDIN
ncbi:hypothetical protein WN48_10723 [Eufriesea mexicana]|uniref:Uncharacterized protein n=1 Tax=Eufriesea mexicana TaxID=516756 RepID=A0A310SFY9_9HYME|nr:hypothetical protein WN48_10723 [Eufriesea mexicana]